MASASVLVIGGAGKTGRRVSEQLRARGIVTRDVSRSTSPAFDWTETKTWAAALDGVSKAYVTYQPDLSVDGASEAIARLSALARDPVNVMNGVQQALGRPARDFSDYVRATAATGVWNVS